MIRRLTRIVVAGLLAIGAVVAACGNTVTAKDCKVSCQDLDTAGAHHL
jgi:hypothetical protein